MIGFAVGHRRAGFAKLANSTINATSSSPEIEMSAKPETMVTFSHRG
jgi:hypothetical protein